jgi:Tfp pilus assembly protein FimT
MDDILLKLAILAAMLGFAAAWNYIAWKSAVVLVAVQALVWRIRVARVEVRRLPHRRAVPRETIHAWIAERTCEGKPPIIAGKEKPKPEPFAEYEPGQWR